VPPEGDTIPSTAAKLTFVSSSQITYQFNNTSDVGTWTVKVNNPDAQSSGMASFTVTNSITTTNRALGLDVSHIRGTIDWSKVKGASNTFAFIKSTEGTDFKDPNFTNNMQNAHSNGIFVGAYHFALPLENPGTNGAIAEAKYFLSNSLPYIISANLPPVLDIEDYPYGTNPNDPCVDATNSSGYSVDLVCELGQIALSVWVRAWVKEVEKDTGVKPIIYMTPNYARNMDSDLNAYPLWIAYYPSTPDTNPASLGPWANSWTFMQYAVTGTTVNGITNPPVDLDVFNGNLAALTTYVTGGAPVISNPKLTGTTFMLSVPTQIGFNYTLEYKNSFSDANWTAVQTISGTGGMIILTDTGATGLSRLYRVRVQR
jgi:GH25 family lysozyme M1 (1,4-beta-N-acetylmuramidase)